MRPAKAMIGGTATAPSALTVRVPLSWSYTVPPSLVGRSVPSAPHSRSETTRSPPPGLNSAAGSGSAANEKSTLPTTSMSAATSSG